MLLKIVLFAYSHGIVSSRDIESACPATCHIHRTLRRYSTALHQNRQYP
ncbi:MAG: hypothetical protein M3P47_06300 [Pseudomonadota bacterium]|nr:hypothetical protein [Pseudomonadota bacterium]